MDGQNIDAKKQTDSIKMQKDSEAISKYLSVSDLVPLANSIGYERQ